MDTDDDSDSQALIRTHFLHASVLSGDGVYNLSGHPAMFSQSNLADDHSDTNHSDGNTSADCIPSNVDVI